MTFRGRNASTLTTTSAVPGSLNAAQGKSGERLCTFPMDEDYEPALDSKVADIKQCTLDGGSKLWCNLWHRICERKTDEYFSCINFGILA